MHSTGCRGDRAPHWTPERSLAGVSAAVQETTASIGLILATWYGHNIADIAEAVRHNVVHRVQAMTGLTVTAVSITIDDVIVAETAGAQSGPGRRRAAGRSGPAARCAAPAAEVRQVNRLASTLLGAFLIIGGLFLAGQALALLFTGTTLVNLDGWYAALTSTTFGEPVVLFWSALATAAGLTLLTAELLHWRPQRVAVPGTGGWHLDRAALEQRLTAAARAVPGVRRARVRLRRDAAGWRPRLRVECDRTVRPAVEAAVRHELGWLTAPDHIALGPRRTPA